MSLTPLRLEAGVCAPLWSGLGPAAAAAALLLLLLQLVAELLGVRILQGLDRHRCLGPGLPLDAALVHHGGLNGDGVGAQDGEIEQELGAEIVIVGFYPLLNLIGLGVQWNLKGGKYGKVVIMKQTIAMNPMTYCVGGKDKSLYSLNRY